MYAGRKINDALEQTIRAARGQASSVRPPVAYWQDLFVEEGIYSYDLITAGLKPGVADGHWVQYEAQQRDKVAQKKGDHHSHAADHEWTIQRNVRAEVERYAWHSLTVVYDAKHRKFTSKVDWYKARLIKPRKTRNGTQKYDFNLLVKDQRCYFIPYPYCYAQWITLWRQRRPGRTLSGLRSPITLLTSGTGLQPILSALYGSKKAKRKH